MLWNIRSPNTIRIKTAFRKNIGYGQKLWTFKSADVPKALWKINRQGGSFKYCPKWKFKNTEFPKAVWKMQITKKRAELYTEHTLQTFIHRGRRINKLENLAEFAFIGREVHKACPKSDFSFLPREASKSERDIVFSFLVRKMENPERTKEFSFISRELADAEKGTVFSFLIRRLEKSEKTQNFSFIFREAEEIGRQMFFSFLMRKLSLNRGIVLRLPEERQIKNAPTCGILSKGESGIEKGDGTEETERIEGIKRISRSELLKNLKKTEGSPVRENPKLFNRDILLKFNIEKNDEPLENSCQGCLEEYKALRKNEHTAYKESFKSLRKSVLRAEIKKQILRGERRQHKKIRAERSFTYEAADRSLALIGDKAAIKRDIKKYIRQEYETKVDRRKKRMDAESQPRKLLKSVKRDIHSMYNVLLGKATDIKGENVIFFGSRQIFKKLYTEKNRRAAYTEKKLGDRCNEIKGAVKYRKAEREKEPQRFAAEIRYFKERCYIRIMEKIFNKVPFTEKHMSRAEKAEPRKVRADRGEYRGKRIRLKRVSVSGEFKGVRIKNLNEVLQQRQWNYTKAQRDRELTEEVYEGAEKAENKADFWIQRQKFRGELKVKKKLSREKGSSAGTDEPQKRVDVEKFKNSMSGENIVMTHRGRKAELLKRFWIISAAGFTDALILPDTDYPYEKDPVLFESGRKNNGNFDSVYPNEFYRRIDRHPVSEGREIGKEEIDVDIAVMVDLINIFIMMWFKYTGAFWGWTGTQAVLGITSGIFEYMNLKTSRINQEKEGLRESYDRAFRWLRWEAEKISLLARNDMALRGNYYVGLMLEELINYMEDHHFDTMPLFEDVNKMDEWRGMFGRDLNNDISWVLDKVKGIRHRKLGGKK